MKTLKQIKAINVKLPPVLWFMHAPNMLTVVGSFYKGDQFVYFHWKKPRYFYPSETKVLYTVAFKLSVTQINGLLKKQYLIWRIISGFSSILLWAINFVS